MTAVALDLDDLLNWARYMQDLAEVTGPAAVRALNGFGEQMSLNKAEDIARQTGLDPSDVLDGMVTYQADLANPEFTMDASAVGPIASPNWQRPWETRRSNSYEQEKLLSIITRIDCCELCERIAEEGPYTIEQINEMAAKWANFIPLSSVAQQADIHSRTNLLHPNCFCATRAWRGARRSVEAFVGNRSLGQVTARDLARMIGDEVTLALRDKKK